MTTFIRNFFLLACLSFTLSNVQAMILDYDEERYKLKFRNPFQAYKEYDAGDVNAWLRAWGCCKIRCIESLKTPGSLKIYQGFDSNGTMSVLVKTFSPLPEHLYDKYNKNNFARSHDKKDISNFLSDLYKDKVIPDDDVEHIIDFMEIEDFRKSEPEGEGDPVTSGQ